MDLDRRALLSALGSVTVATVGAPSTAAATAPGHTRERAARLPAERLPADPPPVAAKATVIDVHTHMYGRSWLAALKAAADKDVHVQPAQR